MNFDQFQWFYTFIKTKNHQFRQILKKTKNKLINQPVSRNIYFRNYLKLLKVLYLLSFSLKFLKSKRISKR